MNSQLLKNYRRFREHPTSMLVGRAAEMALRNARTITEFESRDDVRIRLEEERESYFDVYGKPDSEKAYKALCDTLDSMGCYCVIAEYRDADGEWHVADTIGMCVYDNPESPYENCYAPELMQSALDCVNHLEPEYSI